MNTQKATNIVQAISEHSILFEDTRVSQTSEPVQSLDAFSKQMDDIICKNE